MSRTFSAIGSFLRPDDAQFSDEQAFQVQVHRLLTLFGAVGISVFGVVRWMTSPGAVDPVGARIAVVALLTALFGASYVSSWVRHTYVRWMRGAIYVFMGWFTVVAALNTFTGTYSLGLLLTYAVLMAAVGFGARRMQPVLWFAGYGLALVAVAVLLTPTAELSPLVIVASLATVAIVQSAVLYGRLTARGDLKRRQDRLQRTSARLEVLFDRSPDMINVHDIDGNLIDPNPSLIEKTGFAEDELEEMKVWDLDVALDPEKGRVLWESMKTGDRRKVEGRYRRKDGSTFPVEVHIRRFDLAGADRFIAISRDVTERHRQEAELRRKERRYQAVFEDPGILVGRTAPDGTLLEVNRRAMQYVDVDEEEVVGMPYWETPWWEDKMRPLIREKIEEAAAGNYVEYEADLERPDGEPYSLSGVIRPVTNTDGEVISLFVSARDVTERRRREQELERYREYTDRLLDAIDDVFFVQDTNGDLQRWNQSFAEVSGYSDAEVRGMNGIDFVPKKDRERTGERIRSVFEKGHARLEAPFLCKDGSAVPYEFVASRVEHPDGDARLVGIGRDISERKAREQELRRSRERWQRLVESHQDGIQISIGGAIRYINAAGASILGAEGPDDVIGEPVGRFLGGRTTGPSENWAEEVDEMTANEQEVVGLDGQSRIVESYSIPIEFEGRAATQTVLRDVTVRHEMEEQLRERREKIESLYRATSGLLTASSRESVSERIHTVLQDVFGYPLTAVGYVQNGEIVPNRAELPETPETPPSRARSVSGNSIAARAYQSGETVVIDDLRALDNDIDYGDLRSAVGIPLGPHGAIIMGQFEVGAFDSFDLRLIEILAAQATVVLNGLERLEELQQSERRFRGIFENAAVGIAVLDERGQILEANPVLREMTGYDRDELHGQHFEVLSHPEEFSEDAQLYDELAAGERDRYQMEKRYQRKDGSVFWGRLTVSRHEGRDEGKVIGMVEDIDDQKRYETELREAKEDAERMNRLKSAFLANMSHEIRTPLTSIIGFAEAIGDEVEELEDRFESPELGTLSHFSGLIKQGGQRLMETLDSVLNLSKLEAGEMELTFEPVDVAAEVEQAGELFERKAVEMGINLHTERPSDPVQAHVDEGGLRIALRNLLSNAIKYTDRGGHVWVRARETDEEAVVEVEDTGVGMDPEQVPELFEAFKQESEGVSREYEGSGLGLAVTRRIIAQMGGSIDVETEKGEGTCFTVHVPLREGNVES